MELFKSRTRVAYTNAVGDKVYPVVVDIKKGIKSTEDIQFVSSDVNTGILSVAFISGNENFNVSGADVVCSVMRPDASTLELPCEVVRENIVEVPLGINGTSQDGVYSFDFKVLKGGNKVVGTPIMNYSVSLSIGNDIVVEEDDRLPVLTMLMTQLTELKGEARESINQANTATVASKEATAKAIEATNNANAVSERVSQETATAITRVDNTIVGLNNTVSEKISEIEVAKSDMTNTVSNKVNEVEARFNALTSSQQQDAEVIDARDGETSLKARLDRDIEKAKQVYVNVEGSNISTDSSSGYLKDVEILGNTIQDASNLADIRSVGDAVEGQELYEIPVLSVGKNLFCFELVPGGIDTGSGYESSITNQCRTGFLKLKPGKYTLSKNTFMWWSILIYDKNFNFSHTAYNAKDNGGTFNITENDYYVRFKFDYTVEVALSDNIQLEEGTVATPYEPYQEDKLTILSPVQLEKVRDVADRIICKDGVWGVEKNIKTDLLCGANNEGFTLNKTLAKGGYQFTWGANMGAIVNKNSEVISSTMKSYVTSNEEYSSNIWIYNGDTYVIHHPTISTVGEIKLWLQANPTIVKFALNTPQFIPLPHDQQVKLRTFANKTNISFGCEIEGTIKAQVPKSIGSSINTHTEQINNLNKELDRVKKLEESTVSTVTTESDFTTVEATSNGYFEDVKLEGKTLVNKSITKKLLNQTKAHYLDVGIMNVSDLVADKVYTLLYDFNCDVSFNMEQCYIGCGSNLHDLTLETSNRFTPKFGRNIVNFSFNATEIQSIKDTGCSYVQVRVFIDIEKKPKTSSVTNILLLEGDHTQNPPSYFEGLMSVGEDTEEISVKSVKNLLDYTKLVNKVTDGTTGFITINNNRLSLDVKDRIEVYSPQISVKCRDVLVAVIGFVEKDGVPIYDSGYLPLNTTSNLSLPSEVKYITINSKIGNETPISKEALKNVFIYHLSDKKSLLYFDTETQTWEKPVLREWDSIEKHSDGKYYYHQRSGEVVYDGSEDEKWWDTSEYGSERENTLEFRGHADNILRSTTVSNLVCDKFNFVANLWSNDVEGICCMENNSIDVRIPKTKLPTQNTAGFKSWIASNNFTVVYQLAEEKVYECTNIDLITYANETNYIVNCGAIAPKSTLKVHNNISNVVSLLQEKVSLLENKFIEGLKKVLAGDMYSLAELLYPEDFEEVETENEVMLLPLE